jgi:hypothetical protein
MDPETHKEIVEIKKEVKELRQAQDAEFQFNREKYENLIIEAINDDIRTAEILLLVDGFRSAKEIEKLTNTPQKTCWRKLDRLVSKDIIYPLEKSKKGSPIYQKQRWFIKLRLEDFIRNRYFKDVPINATR